MHDGGARSAEAGEAPRISVGEAYLAEGTKCSRAGGRARRPGGGRALNQRMRREREGAGQPGPGGLLPGRILAFLPSEIGACGPA